MQNKKTILIVDDDETFLYVLARSLEKRAYCVLTAQNNDQALLHAKENRLDYAVVDLKIANESGLDIVSPLKEMHCAIRILILTGYSSITTAVSAIKRGAFDYACKPLGTDEILVKLLEDKVETKDATIASDPVTVKRLQWEHIQRVLDDNDGNISATARSLGMHRRTLQRKLQKKPVSK